MKIRELLSLDTKPIACVGQRNVTNIYADWDRTDFYVVIKDNGDKLIFPRGMFISVWEKNRREYGWGYLKK